MILVDSSVWIAYLRGAPTEQAQRLDQLLGIQPILLGDLILLEILQGARSEVDATRLRSYLGDFELVDLGGRAVVERAAAGYRQLRSSGITVRKSIDLVIGAWCIVNDMPLLHADRDFEPMATHLGLRCI